MVGNESRIGVTREALDAVEISDTAFEIVDKGRETGPLDTERGESGAEAF